MAEEKTTFKIDLDASEFLKSTNKAQSALDGVLDSDKAESFLGALGKFAPAIGVISGAALALKASFDMVFEAEAVKKINDQFVMLAQNAGIAADQIKNEMVAASQGLVDDDEILKSANQAIIQLGSNASKLGDIMQLARKVTVVMGGDLLNNFEKINQAISTGSVKSLKQMGLIGDLNKAYEDYARKIGIAANALSEHDKQAAVLEKVLENGQKKFKGVSTEVNTATESWQKLKVAVADIGEAIAVAFDKVAGNTFRNAMKSIATFADGFKEHLKSALGDEEARSSIALERHRSTLKALEQQILETKEKIEDKSKRPFFERMFGWNDKSYENKIKQIETMKASVEAAIKKEEDLIATRAPAAAVEGEAPKAKGDPKVLLANRAKFEQEMLKLRDERIKTEMKLTDDAEEAERLYYEQIQILEQQTQEKINAMRLSTDLSTAQKKELELQMHETFEKQKQALIKETEDIRIAAATRSMQTSKGFIDYLSRSEKLALEEDKKNENVHAVTVMSIRKSLTENTSRELDKVVKGQESAAEAIKNIAFLAIADQAQAEGALMFGRSVWPPQPPGLAGGLALMALASALRSKAGGGGAGGGTETGGGGGAGSSPTMPGISPETGLPQTPTPMVQPKKSVTLQIMGSYYETEQTKTKLMEMIREATDATDFKYVQIGQR